MGKHKGKDNTQSVGGVRRTAVAMAVVAVLAVASALPASAAIVTSGQVSPDPTGGSTTGNLTVGNTGVGQVTVNGGSSLASQRVNLGANPGANGSIVVTGAGSTLSTNFGVVGNFFNANVGSQGTGSLSVLNGGTVLFGTNDPTCQSACRLKVSNGAGSDGTVTVSGVGSTLSGVGGVQVGWASVFTQAVSGFNFGTAGGASTGLFQVLAGGTVNSSRLDIGAKDLTSEVNGAETSSGKVVIDGAGSAWTVTRNSTQNNAQALVRLATEYGTSGTLEIRNGGVLKIDGSIAPNQQSGINVGGAAGADLTNATGTITVKGPGSRIEMASGTGGFINLGRGNGIVATMNVQDGGVVTGTSNDGLGFISVGRGGATATLNVTGANSLLRLSGTDAVGSGAFLHVGRFDTGAAGTGVVNIANGGRIEIDNGNQVLTSNNQTGMIIGNTAGSVGSMAISGAGSELRISGSTGKTPFVGVGRDGGTGQLTISAGGRLEVSSQHISAPSSGSYLTGEASLFIIGQRFAGNDGLTSTGTVTVTGAGSELVMSGAADRLIQVGSSANSIGTLNLAQGGKAVTGTLLVGNNSGTGTLNMNGGTLLLDGLANGGPAAGGGAGMAVGRGGGTGTATISNGSTIVMTPTAPNGGLAVGGTSLAPGGNGTLLLSGGSSITINGPDAAATVGSGGTPTNAAVGTMVLSGTGTSLSVTGSNARVLVGNSADAVGTLIVGKGSSVSSGGLIGLGHNGSASTGGTGVLCVNGTATAVDMIIGAGGVLCGSGTINANVVNQGLITPGNSPGTLTFNGAFDNSGGKIVLEVQSLGNGQYATDQLVFSDWSQVTMGGEIEFVFLGNTDPTAFQDAGLFDLGSFFKQVNASGAVVDLDDSQLGLFSNTQFDAQAESYVISSFVFNPLTGASFSVNAVPLPSSLPLALLGLAALGLRRVRRPAAAALA